jgi:hypothetical protein
MSAACLSALGWEFALNRWTPMWGYLRLGDLPKGRYVIEFRGRHGGHFSALVGGAVRDLWDSSTCPLWGWWSKPAPRERHMVLACPT